MLAGRTTRTGSRVVAAVMACSAVLVIGAGPLGAAPPSADGPTAAGYATAWLADQLDASIPMQNFGSPDWGVTLDAALGMVASGSGGAQVDAVWTSLLADREAAVAPGGVDSAGRLARVILLATVRGEDPRSVGAAPGQDLVGRLESLRRTGGADTGLFGAQDPTYDGAFRQGYALAALVAAGVTPDPTSVEWLLAQQCGPEADPGAWMPYRADLSVPCAVDPAMFVGPDTNATAAAITGLSAVGQGGAAIDAALGWLDTVQEADGGWGQMVGYGTDPNSTALVIQALIAADAAAAPRFADRAATPLGALLSFQLGCSSPEADRGAFTFPGSNDAPNGFATAQAVGAAAGVAVLFEPGTVDAGVTPLDCTPATTTTTSTSTTTTVAPTTAAPTTAAPTTAAPTTAAPTPSGEVSVLAAGASRSTTEAPASSPSGLALTGVGTTAPAVVGAAAVLLGLVLLAGARRREDHGHAS